MGRPLAKRFFGNTDLANVAGEFLSTITTASGANNSSGFTNGSTSQVTLSAPQIAGGVTATVTVQSVVGALLQLTAGNGSGTTFTYSGTGVSTTQTVWTGLTQKSTSGSGTGAVFTVTRTASTTTYSGNTTVTVTTPGASYAVSDTIVISGTSLGGTTTTNDLTITITGAVATSGQITGLTITNPGAGYTSAPTPTYSTGTIGTLAFTYTLSTTQQNGIVPQAVTVGSTNRTSGNDIIKQVSTRRYKVQTQDGTAICTLQTATPSAAGQMIIVATDSTGCTYYVTKLTKNKATLTRFGGGSYEFADGSQTPWTLASPTLNTNVQLANA